jgi:homoserine O-acetyltransferase
MTFVSIHAAATCADPQPTSRASGDLAVALNAPVARRGVAEATLAFRHAGTRRVRLAWESHGREDAPCVLVAGGISAGRHVGASASYPEPGW